MTTEAASPYTSTKIDHLETFRHVRSDTITSLNVTLHQFEHIKTGATHLHISADNTENAFMVAFRTVPTDSTGVAHILEHTVLCGSEKYPVRDPFFMMLRRSLNTFMNAFTSSDWTAYPFASQNRKDYFNLLSVYLDATFFSRLHALDFAQEGHRLEFEKANDPNSNLTFKGVVYNEMKGSMSAINSQLYQRLTHHLFPSVTYHYNSGGEPTDIPDLTHADLINFYKKHYHPSNAIFLTFGDIPAKTLQAQFENDALSRFERAEENIIVPLEKPAAAPIRIQEYYGLEEAQTNEKTYHLLAWLLGESANATERLEATLLSEVLLQNSAAPLRKLLETFPKGSAPAALCGLEDSKRQMSFICGIEGSNPEDADAFEQAVFQVLKTVAEAGVDHEVVESVCHQIELSQREIGGDGFPYGLQLLVTALSGHLHGGAPIELLDIDPALKRLRENIQDPEYIKSLASKYLLENKHFIRLTVAPDPELNSRVLAQEKARLAQINSKLTEDEKQSIVTLAAELKARQNQKDDESILPKVTLADVPAETPVPQPDHQTEDLATKLLAATKPEKSEGHHAPVPVPKVTQYKAGTNGISYVQTLTALPALDTESLAVLPLFSQCLTEVGVGESDYLAVQQRQTQYTGGLRFLRDIRPLRGDRFSLGAFCGLSSKALHKNLEPMLALMDDTLENARFDEYERIKDLIAQLRASREQSVTGQGHGLAMAAAASTLSPVSHLFHQLSGLASIKSLKALHDALSSDTKALETLCAQFKSIHQKLQTVPKFRLLVSDQEDWENLAKRLALNANPTNFDHAEQAFDYPVALAPENQAWITNTQVNFCAKAYPTVCAEHADAAALRVLAHYLKHGYLHRAIREEGGAYGGGATYDHNNGIFRFFSYRDPRVMDTLADFDSAISWLLGSPLDDDALEQAILGVISAIDKPGSPAGEAKQAFQNALQGRTAETINADRQRIMKVSSADLKRVADHYLNPKTAKIQTAAIITNASTFESLTHADDFKRNDL
jgi:Zn-dependent M16 (insulinase) family peptidase